MKKYRVNVNGTVYEVQLEEITGEEAKVAPKAPEAPAPAAAPVSAPAGAQEVNAPMPGTILNIVKNVGDTVKAGETVMILEAMKMENEIAAPVDGKITSINVNKGATVESGVLLYTIG
jgi:biotin carboxyl carrier protein